MLEGGPCTTLGFCSDGSYFYWVWCPANITDKSAKGIHIFVTSFKLEVMHGNNSKLVLAKFHLESVAVLAKFCLESVDVLAKFRSESVDVLENFHSESVPAEFHLESVDVLAKIPFRECGCTGKILFGE